jgi:type IV secretory pathway VirB4 component
MLIPFSTREIFQTGEALYYGRNALSGNMIMADRKRLKNPNGIILGIPGSGKSFAAKREITNAFLVTSDDIIVSDPESEYAPLVAALGGQLIKVAQSSKDHINPMDININYSEDESPLALKYDFILSLCELIVGGRGGLEPIEKTVIDRAVRTVYQDYLSDSTPDPSRMPVLEDLYDELLTMPEAEARRVATALEIYVHGSLNIFNHRTNVDIANRLVCFDLKELGKQLRKLGMLIVQDQVWNRVTQNRAQRKSTRYYMDEMHLLLKEEQTAAYSVEIWKRFRKWGGIPTGITQNCKDLLASREIENIFDNSDIIYLLSQASGDQEILGRALRISPKQMNYVTNAPSGEGLILYGGVILPFKDRFPEGSALYRIMTTLVSDLDTDAGR